MIYNYLDKSPQLDESVFVAPSADVIGNVTIGKDSSVWFQSVIRGDMHYIKIGSRTNVQDGCVLHITNNTAPLNIADEVTIGHRVVLHGCTVESGCLIGMGAILLDNCVIGKNSLIAAGTLVTQRKVIPPRSLVMGNPGKVVRELTDKEVAKIYKASQYYIDYAANYRNTKPAIEEKR
ncbi:MAG: gamma carbonic anhydrase family protein [Calditrichaeota bacterium]|nr:MAG: gamma carbonic anhydrase family protein [Calditrichota bacterium]